MTESRRVVIAGGTGRSVDCVKTPDNCDAILRSRVESTLALGQAVRSVDAPPPVWVQMATAHRYGDPLPRLAGLAKWGLGGKVGHGRQGISWIHEVDMNRLFLRTLEDESMAGAYLATAPEPVANERFMRELRRALGVPIGLPAFGWMVRIGAPLILRTDPELALYGRYCISRRLREAGFDFQFSDVTSALQDLYDA